MIQTKSNIFTVFESLLHSNKISLVSQEIISQLVDRLQVFSFSNHGIYDRHKH